MATLTISGDQAWTQFDVNAQGYDIVDASAASWNTRNTGSPQLEYPLRVRNSTTRVRVMGGKINGLFDQTMDWGTLYGEGNSAAVFLQNCPSGSSVTGWTMEHVFDGIRIVGTDDYLIDDCLIHWTRDDAVEADQGRSGTIRNCLFENCFSGISVGDANTPVSALNNTVSLERCLVHMTSYNYRGAVTHGPVIKADQNTPKLLVTDSVFAITKADHDVTNRLALAFGKVDPRSAGNYYLNLTDDPLPGNYPTLPASFTYLRGQPARDHWAAARAAFLHGSVPTPPEAQVVNVIAINPDTGAIRVETDEAFAGAVTVGASNAYGSVTRNVTLTVA